MKKPIAGPLGPLLERDELRSVFRRRRDENEYRKIELKDRRKYEAEALQIHKEMASGLWIKRSKSADLILEDRIWCLFYRMSYPRISGQNFSIELKNADGAGGSKRVNVLALDDETAIVVE